MESLIVAVALAAALLLIIVWPRGRSRVPSSMIMRFDPRWVSREEE